MKGIGGTDFFPVVIKGGGVQSVQAGANTTVNNADPLNPIVGAIFSDSLSVTLGVGGTYTSLAALIAALKGRMGDTLNITLTSNITASYNGELTGFRNVVFSLSGKTWTGNFANCDVVTATSANVIGTIRDSFIVCVGYTKIVLGANSRVINCELNSGVTLYSGGAGVTISGCWSKGNEISLGINVAGATLTVQDCNFSNVALSYIQTPFAVATQTVDIIGCLFGDVRTENAYINCASGYTSMGNVRATKGSAWPALTAPITLTRGGVSVKQIEVKVHTAPYAIKVISGVAQITDASNTIAPCNWTAGVTQPTGIYFGV